MNKYNHDEYGNVICPDCMAHVNQLSYEQHNCPTWLRALVRAKEDIVNQRLLDDNNE